MPPQVHYLLQPCADYVQTAVETVVDIHREDVPGDVLVFLTGERLMSLCCCLLVCWCVCRVILWAGQHAPCTFLPYDCWLTCV